MVHLKIHYENTPVHTVRMHRFTCTIYLFRVFNATRQLSHIEAAPICTMKPRLFKYIENWTLKHKWFERSPVAEHFCLPEHDFLNHAALCCLDHNPEWTDRIRKAPESYWIRRLNTLWPYGINKGDRQRESSFLSQGMRQFMWNVLFLWFSGITA